MRPSHRIRPALLASLVATAALWFMPAQAATPEATYQDLAFAATNAQRALHGRPALTRQDCAQRFAVKQAQKMASQERMFHQDLGPVLRQCHLSRAGENVAYGFLDGTSVVVDGWMESPPHRANILDRRFKLVGIGARLGDDGLWYVAQVFGRRA